MKAVKGYTKEDYRKECIEEGGEVFEFNSCSEAAQHLANMAGYTAEIAEEGIKNDTNCDWIIFEDGSVLFRYYGKNYDEDYISGLRGHNRRK